MRLMEFGLCLQVDFNLPELFSARFVNSAGKMDRPVMLHQAVLGSLERWIGILLEHHNGNLPVWLAPTQLAIASISEKAADWAEDIFLKLKHQGVRVELRNGRDTIGKKIRDLSQRKIPLIAIVGDQEALNQQVKLHCLGDNKQPSLSLPQLQSQLALLSEGPIK